MSSARLSVGDLAMSTQREPWNDAECGVSTHVPVATLTTATCNVVNDSVIAQASPARKARSQKTKARIKESVQRCWQLTAQAVMGGVDIEF